MRAKRIWFLKTDKDTYVLRHDLFNTGVRWDSKSRQWFSSRKAPVKRAAELVGGRVQAAIMEHPPTVSTSPQGGRPRKHRRVVLRAEAHANGNTPPTSVAPLGQPFMRTNVVEDRRTDDRRSRGERRGPNRPPAVLCVPVAAEGVLQEAS